MCIKQDEFIAYRERIIEELLNLDATKDEIERLTDDFVYDGIKFEWDPEDIARVLIA